MIEINLLPEQLRGRTQPTAKRTPTLAPVPNAFPIGLVGLTLLMGLLIVVSSTRVGSTQRRVRQIEHELKQAKTQAAEAEQVTAELPTVEARYQVLADRLDGKIAWAELLRVISLHCPEGVLLTSIKLEIDRRTNQPGRLVIAGAYEGTLSLEMLFADGLKESATFAEVFEAVIPEKNLEPDGRTSFALFCSFRPRADQLSTGVLSPAATEKGTTP
jgi:Tfp pilus assembly protein PilN